MNLHKRIQRNSETAFSSLYFMHTWHSVKVHVAVQDALMRIYSADTLEIDYGATWKKVSVRDLFKWKLRSVPTRNVTPTRFCSNGRDPRSNLDIVEVRKLSVKFRRLLP